MTDAFAAFTRSTAEVLQHFGVSEHTGLSDDRIHSLRTKHGPNGTSRDTSLAYALHLPMLT